MASPGNPTFGANWTGGANVVTLERTLGMPAEGPKCIPLNFDFTATNSFKVDLSSYTNLGKISMVQTIFVDASDSAVDLIVLSQGTGQQLKIKAGTQGYYPILIPNPIMLTLTCIGGPADLQVIFLNFPIQPGVWTP
jgi:hypothetical protein